MGNPEPVQEKRQLKKLGNTRKRNAIISYERYKHLFKLQDSCHVSICAAIEWKYESRNFPKSSSFKGKILLPEAEDTMYRFSDENAFADCSCIQKLYCSVIFFSVDSFITKGNEFKTCRSNKRMVLFSFNMLFHLNNDPIKITQS